MWVLFPHNKTSYKNSTCNNQSLLLLHLIMIFLDMKLIFHKATKEVVKMNSFILSNNVSLFQSVYFCNVFSFYPRSCMLLEQATCSVLFCNVTQQHRHSLGQYYKRVQVEPHRCVDTAPSPPPKKKDTILWFDEVGLNSISFMRSWADYLQLLV